MSADNVGETILSGISYHCEAGIWKRKLEAEAVEAVKFLWKRKHFEKRSWKWKRTRKRLTSYVAGSGIKKYSTASTSL